ncbi:MAG: mucD 5 [Gemmataceae bacterium]|nr:mucD 5 [Gemmataceae bacterium]
MTRTDLTPRMSWAAIAVTFAWLAGPARADEVDRNAATEMATKAAAARAAPSVVKIETAGGLEVVGGGGKGPGGPGGPPTPGIARGTGATTGLIVDPDGFVVTSSFNFANKPTDIFVTIPGRPTRLVAKIVATDQTRMLTLLKVDAKDLPLPPVFAKQDVRVGQWALALGRTLDPNTDHPPSVSAGIISATNRLWGKAFQTDAKVSPANYGGPLVSIDGRVFGVLVPASARAEGETAGFEWYDSGIGFAIPLEDIRAKLPALKQGKDLRRGLLGINPQSPDAYNSQPVIGAIQPDSAADRAGLKVGDRIVAIDGKPVPNFSTVQHILGPKYEGDVVKVKVARGDKETEFPSIALLGTATAYVNAFLGILPMRDDPTPGVQIRFVYPKSPAEAAGLKAGDRIMKLGRADAMALAAVRTRQQLTAALAQLLPGTAVKIEVKRKEGEKVETVTAKLTTVPDAVPEKLPMPSSAGKALEGQPKKGKEVFAPMAPPPTECGEEAAPPDDPFKDPKKDKEKIETGYLERTDEGLGRKYWLYVPDNYDANVSHGLIVWFHPAGQGGKDGEKMARTFREFCEEHHFIMMGPKSNNAEGWVPSETELVMADVKRVLGQYTFDRARVVAHGMGNGGQMAFYVGFNARDVFRGVATIGSVLGTLPKDNVANQPVSFFVAVGDKDPLLKDVEASKGALEEKRFPLVYRVVKETGKEYFDVKAFAELLNWLDSLDRI